MTFTHIPEVLEQVASHLDPQSLRNFRLTKRWHWRVSNPAFVAAHFETLELDFTPHSIQKLHNTVNHTALRSAVRALHITIRPQSSQADTDFWALTPDGELDITSKEAAKVRDSLCCLGKNVSLRIEDRTPLVLSEHQHWPALSMLGVTHLALSTFTDPRCPFSGDVVIVDKTSWPDVPRGYGSSRRFQGMVESREFQRRWASRVERLRYTWAITPPPGINAQDAPISRFTMGEGRNSPHIIFSGVLGSLSEHTPTSLALDGIVATPIHLAAFIHVNRETLCSLSLSNIYIGTGPGLVTWTTFFDLLSRATFPLLEEISVSGVRSAPKSPKLPSSSRMYFTRLLLKRASMKACGGRFELQRSTRSPYRYPGVRYVGPPSSMKAATELLSSVVADMDHIARDREFWRQKFREIGDVVTIVDSWSSGA